MTPGFSLGMLPDPQPPLQQVKVIIIIVIIFRFEFDLAGCVCKPPASTPENGNDCEIHFWSFATVLD